MKIIVTGATGLVGGKLTRKFIAAGHQVIAVTRSQERARHLGVPVVEWKNPETEIFPVQAFEGVDVIVHLAGEHIAATRWTDEQKMRIRNSRILSTRNIVAAIAAASVKPKSFICASAIGFYGDRGAELLPESASAGTDFLADVCKEWEQEALAANSYGVRTVQVRIGIVLAQESGALKEMLPIFKLGLGGSLGAGKQYFPWIHVNDVVGIIQHAMLNELIQGPVNAVAPSQTTNAEFTRALGASLHRPAFFCVPAFALRLGLGEMSDMLLSSYRVIPTVASETGYRFEFQNLPHALQDLVS